MSGIRSIINKFASQTSPPGSTGPPMNHVSGPGMPAGARSPCINCQANPATPGFQFCSKQCAHAYSGQGPPTHHQGPPGSNQPPGPGHGPGPAGTTNTIFILAPIVANSPTCLIAGCGKPVWRDASGKPSQYCSVAHKKLGSLCLIPGCAKPVHIDANGTKSQYCCYSHRMQGQQSGAAGSPPSTNPTQGNPPNIPGAYPHGNQNPVRSHPPVQPGMCHYPNCLKPVWVDPVGNPSKYCGRKHKDRAASLPQQQQQQQQQQPLQPNPPTAQYTSYPPAGGPHRGDYRSPGPSASLCWLCKKRPSRPGDMFCSDACTSRGQNFARDILEVHPLERPDTQSEMPFPSPPTYHSHRGAQDTDDYSDDAKYGKGMDRGYYGSPQASTSQKRKSVDRFDYDGMPD